MKNSGIYKITNPNGKIYIGQTVEFNKRIKAYKFLTCVKQKALYNSIKKYGWESHKIELILATNTDLNRKEIFFIEFFNSFSKFNLNGMNMTMGGDTYRGKGRNVYQYDKNGKFIRMYTSASAAKMESGFQHSHIIMCCKGKRRSHAGYMWKHFKTDFIEPLSTKKTLTEKELNRLENLKVKGSYWKGKKLSKEMKSKISEGRRKYLEKI